MTRSWKAGEFLGNNFSLPDVLFEHDVSLLKQTRKRRQWLAVLGKCAVKWLKWRSDEWTRSFSVDLPRLPSQWLLGLGLRSSLADFTQFNMKLNSAAPALRDRTQDDSIAIEGRLRCCTARRFNLSTQLASSDKGSKNCDLSSRFIIADVVEAKRLFLLVENEAWRTFSLRGLRPDNFNLLSMSGESRNVRSFF